MKRRQDQIPAVAKVNLTGAVEHLISAKEATDNKEEVAKAEAELSQRQEPAQPEQQNRK